MVLKKITEAEGNPHFCISVEKNDPDSFQRDGLRIAHCFFADVQHGSYFLVAIALEIRQLQNVFIVVGQFFHFFVKPGNQFRLNFGEENSPLFFNGKITQLFIDGRARFLVAEKIEAFVPCIQK
jgi:hypothetical protein